MSKTKPIPHSIDFERDANAIACECGGYAERDRHMTMDELKNLSCGRDTTTYQCCARAFVCRVCKTRYVGSAPAPEME